MKKLQFVMLAILLAMISTEHAMAMRAPTPAPTAGPKPTGGKPAANLLAAKSGAPSPTMLAKVKSALGFKPSPKNTAGQPIQIVKAKEMFKGESGQPLAVKPTLGLQLAPAGSKPSMYARAKSALGFKPSPKSTARESIQMVEGKEAIHGQSGQPQGLALSQPTTASSASINVTVPTNASSSAPTEFTQPTATKPTEVVAPTVSSQVSARAEFKAQMKNLQKQWDQTEGSGRQRTKIEKNMQNLNNQAINKSAVNKQIGTYNTASLKKVAVNKPNASGTSNQNTNTGSKNATARTSQKEFVEIHTKKQAIEKEIQALEQEIQEHTNLMTETIAAKTPMSEGMKSKFRSTSQHLLNKANQLNIEAKVINQKIEKIESADALASKLNAAESAPITPEQAAYKKAERQQKEVVQEIKEQAKAKEQAAESAVNKPNASGTSNQNTNTGSKNATARASAQKELAEIHTKQKAIEKQMEEISNIVSEAQSGTVPIPLDMVVKIKTLTTSLSNKYSQLNIEAKAINKKINEAA